MSSRVDGIRRSPHRADVPMHPIAGHCLRADSVPPAEDWANTAWVHSVPPAENRAGGSDHWRKLQSVESARLQLVPWQVRLMMSFIRLLPMNLRFPYTYHYADNISLAFQACTFEDLNTSINADIAKFSEYCKRWWLQPSVAKTVVSTFHLHNARIDQELDIIL